MYSISSETLHYINQRQNDGKSQDFEETHNRKYKMYFHFLIINIKLLTSSAKKEEREMGKNQERHQNQSHNQNNAKRIKPAPNGSARQM